MIRTSELLTHKSTRPSVFCVRKSIAQESHSPSSKMKRIIVTVLFACALVMALRLREERGTERWITRLWNTTAGRRQRRN
jgi:hypothetical protein